MKVEYDPKKALGIKNGSNEKSKRKWFVFYFDTNEKMEEVRDILFGSNETDV